MKFVWGILITLFFFFTPSQVFAADELVTITTSTTSITALNEFSVSVTASSLFADTQYYFKAIGGDSNYDVQTKASDGNWLSWNTSWSEMPTFTSDSSGQINTTITSRFRKETTGGDKSLLVRIRKVSTETNIDSNSVTIAVTALPDPTPSPSPSPTPTPTAAASPTPTTKPTVKPTSQPTIKALPTPVEEVFSAQTGTYQTPGYSFAQSSPSSEETPQYQGGSSGAAIVLIFAGIGFVGVALLPFIKRAVSSYNTKTHVPQNPSV